MTSSAKEMSILNSYHNDEPWKSCSEVQQKFLPVLKKLPVAAKGYWTTCGCTSLFIAKLQTSQIAQGIMCFKHHQHHKLHVRIRQSSKIYIKTKWDVEFHWNCHVEYVTSKANWTLGFICDSVNISNPEVIEWIYKWSLVHPVVEYSLSLSLGSMHVWRSH